MIIYIYMGHKGKSVQYNNRSTLHHRMLINEKELVHFAWIKITKSGLIFAAVDKLWLLLLLRWVWTGWDIVAELDKRRSS